VFLSEPGPTGYDINFSLFGFPVRVHPLFFLAPLLFGRGLIGDGNIGVSLLVVTFVFFVSILFHELGHTWAFRYFGIDSRIVLHWMGGLAVPERNSWQNGGRSASRMTHGRQMVVSIAGPLANVVLAIAVLGIGVAIGGELQPGILLGFIPVFWLDFANTAFNGNEYFDLLFYATIILNLLWAIFNLVPVYPLDGGQLARAFMQKIDPTDGLKNSLYLSIGAAALLAVFAVSKSSTIMAIFFGFMAYSSWQSLQQFSGRRW